MHISDHFDAGNIEVIDAGCPAAVRLAIRADSNADFFQWFHFRATGVAGVECAFRIENAGEASYTKGWEGYQAVASYDREDWFRVPTEYSAGVLTIRHTPERDSVYYAYFEPYSGERGRDFLAHCLAAPQVRHTVLGQTVDGADLDLLTIGAPGDGKRVCWTIGRQHPGESQASWWMEGFLGRLIDPADPVARAVLDRALVHVVPHMNPDGARRGNLRANAAGANLNREWAEPTMEKSPEVFLTRARMRETGVDFCLDVHGDEGLPYVFIAGSDGIPSLTERQTNLRAAYDAALLRASPDYQTEKGYPKAPPGKGNLTMCTAHVAEHFGALAMTLEMPFKDNANAPDPRYGWSAGRCRHLGGACLDALHAVIDELRD
jgi:murein tripeptide amidase MpaA